MSALYPFRGPYPDNSLAELRFEMWRELWKLRLSRGMNNRQIAARIGRRWWTVGRVFADWRYLDYREASDIARALDARMRVELIPVE